MCKSNVSAVQARAQRSGAGAGPTWMELLQVALRKQKRGALGECA